MEKNMETKNFPTRLRMILVGPPVRSCHRDLQRSRRAFAPRVGWPSGHRPRGVSALARELIVVSPTTRVVVPRWETCANCGETYDVNEGEDECTFHPGDLEVNEAKFLDWDEDCHGPMDSEHNREEFPENFSWTCCNGDGMTEGCANGKHSVAVPKKRRV
ncbi:hypothetical protein B0H13DRAFT_828179 [Mycena leptocephala]|nr:hypothetical protein B0H13DRAFT_828179 [Mycena leptocephala]